MVYGIVSRQASHRLVRHNLRLRSLSSHIEHEHKGKAIQLYEINKEKTREDMQNKIPVPIRTMLVQKPSSLSPQVVSHSDNLAYVHSMSNRKYPLCTKCTHVVLSLQVRVLIRRPRCPGHPLGTEVPGRRGVWTHTLNGAARAGEGIESKGHRIAPCRERPSGIDLPRD